MALFIEKRYRTAAAVFTVLLGSSVANQANASVVLSYINVPGFASGATWGSMSFVTNSGIAYSSGAEGVGANTSLQIIDGSGFSINTAGNSYTVVSATGAMAGEDVNISTYTLNAYTGGIALGNVTGTTGTLNLTDSSAGTTSLSAGTINLTGAASTINVSNSSGNASSVANITTGAITTAGNMTVSSAAGSGAVNLTTPSITSTGSLAITSTSGQSTNVSISSASSVSNGITLTGTGTAASLTVNGTTLSGTINGGADGQGLLNVSGNSTISSAVGSAATSLYQVNVTGTAGQTAVFSSAVDANAITLNTAGATTFAGSVTSSGGINMAVDNTLNFTGSGSTVAANIAVASNNTGTINANGSTTISGTIGTASNKIKQINVGASDSLTVSSATYVNNNINLANNSSATFNGSLYVGDSTGLNPAITTGTGSTLSLNGDATLMGAITGSGDIVMGGSSSTARRTFNYGVSADDLTLSNGIAIFNAAASTTSSMTLNGTAFFNNAYDTSVGTSLSTGVGSDVTFTGNLSVGTSATFNGLAEVKGTTGAQSLTTGASSNVTFDKDVSVTNNISVAGDTQFNANVTSTNGSMTASGIVNVDGNVLLTNGTLTYNGSNSLIVDGTTTTAGLVLSGGTNTLTGIVSTGTLTTSGSSSNTFSSAVTSTTAALGSNNTFASTYNGGTTNISAGINNFNGAYKNTGDTTVSAGDNNFNDIYQNLGTTKINGGTNDFTKSYESAGTLITAGLNTFHDSYTNTGATTISGGTNIFDGAYSDTTTTNISAGNNTFYGTLSTTTLNVTGGTNTYNGAVGPVTAVTTVNLAGTNTFNSTLKATTINAGGTSTYNGTVTAGTLNVVSSGTVNLNANGTGTLNFSSDGIVNVASGDTWTGTISTSTASTGTLNLSGNRTLSTSVVTGDAIKTLGIGTDGSTVNLNATINANNLRVLGTGTVNVNATQSGNVVMAANGSVNVATGSNLTGSIDATTAGYGTVNFLGNTIVSGAIGATNALGTLNISSGAVSLNGNVNAQNMVYTSDGTVNIGSGVTLNATNINGVSDNVGTLNLNGTATVNSTIGATHAIKDINVTSGTATFNNDIKSQEFTLTTGATATFADGVDITSTIDGLTAGAGTLSFAGTSTVNGNIGGTVAVGQVIASSGVLTFNGKVNATTLQTSTGTIYLNGNGSGTLSFTGDGTVVVASGSNWTGTVTTSTSGTGTLNLLGNRTINSTIASAQLKSIGLGSDGSTSTMTSAVNADHVTILGTGKVVSNVNTSNDFVFAGNGTVEVGDGYTLTGDITTNTASTGTLQLDGTLTVSSTIGTTTKALASVLGGYTGKTVTFGSAVYANTLHVAGNGTVAINAGGSGSIVYDADGKTVIADDQAWTGTVNAATSGKGSLTFSGDASGLTSIGTTGYLKAITLDGSANTVSVSGAVIAATTTDIQDNTFSVGSFTASSGQKIATQITSNSTSGVINVANAATISSSSKINVLVNTSEYIPVGSVFTVVSGGTGSSISNLAEGNVTSDNLMLKFTQSNSGNNLGVKLQLKDITEVTSDADLVEAGKVFYSLPYNINTYITNLSVKLENATTMAQIKDVLGSFLPKSGDGEKNTVSSNNAQVQYLAEQRIDDIRSDSVSDYGFSVSSNNSSSYTDEFGYQHPDYGYSSSNGEFSGISSGAKVSNSSFWVQTYANKITQDTVDGVVGYGAKGYGLALGFDNATWVDDGILGVSFNFGKLNVDGDSSTNPIASDIKNYGVNVYANYEFGHDTFVNSQFGASMSTIDRSRGNAGGAAYTAKANYNSNELSSKLSIGSDFYPVDGMTVTPTVSLTHAMISTDAYKETGAATGLNMNVGSHDESLLRGGMKVEAKMRLMDSTGSILKPGLKAGYYYDFTNDPVQATANYEGSTVSFTTGGSQSSKSSYMLGASIDYLSSANWELATDLDYSFKSGYDSVTGIARITNYF